MGKIKNWCNRNFCTCFVDKLFGKYHGDICKEHDECYERLNSGDSTKDCDCNFLNGLKDKTYNVVAYGMYAMVRIFGRNFKK